MTNPKPDDGGEMKRAQSQPSVAREPISRADIEAEPSAAQMIAAFDLYECELHDIAEEIGERMVGDTSADDAEWSITMGAGHWRCLEAYVRLAQGLTSPRPAENSADDGAPTRHSSPATDEQLHSKLTGGG